jgi:hypothetical protein
MRCIINYQLRLGDIVACFPAAKFLADQGNEIFFSCMETYHPIFENISYCRPLPPSAFKTKHSFDRFYDLQIHRDEYDRYRESKLPWRDYVYGKYPELVEAKETRPIFDRIKSISHYGLPKRFALAAPFGISQSYRIDLDWFFETYSGLIKEPLPLYVLTPFGKKVKEKWGKPLHARSIADLPGLIQSATEFMTINSAPNIIAGGVRENYYHVYVPGFGGQDNLYFPNQTRLRQPDELNRPSWRHLFNQVRYKLMKLFR